jgi:hypothetical protein
MVMIEFEAHSWSTLYGRTKKWRVGVKEEKAMLLRKILKSSLREKSAVVRICLQDIMEVET